MGQYYTPYIENEDGITTLYSWDYGSGLKLMEHSWLGNDFVNAAYTLIDNKPSKVGWVGDYSDDVGVDDKVYKICWEDANYKVKITPNKYFKDGEYYGYLANHSKKEMVDIAKYAELARDKDGWIINPLPLLTAIGNGQGGGDYYERNTNYDMVGYWYMDTISFERNAPFYEDITSVAVFKEE